TSAVKRVGVAQRPAADPAAGGDEDVAEQGQPQDALEPELRHPVVARQLPRRLGEVLVAEAPPALEHADAVALLGQSQRADAAAEARAEDQPVVVVVGHHASTGIAIPRLRILPVGPLGRSSTIHTLRGYL